MSHPLFLPGQLVATPGAINAMATAGTHVLELLSRHVGGDWGDVDAEDRAANDWSLRAGARLLSSYTLATGERVWIITEADRSVTTLLLPQEY